MPEESGIETLAELGRRDPAMLRRKLVRENEHRRIVKSVPYAPALTRWVAEAKRRTPKFELNELDQTLLNQDSTRRQSPRFPHCRCRHTPAGAPQVTAKSAITPGRTSHCREITTPRAIRVDEKSTTLLE